MPKNGEKESLQFPFLRFLHTQKTNKSDRFTVRTEPRIAANIRNAKQKLELPASETDVATWLVALGANVVLMRPELVDELSEVLE